MTSKECLYAILDMLNPEQVDECEKNNYLKIISQDLDRLEIASKNDEGLIRDNVKLIKRNLEFQDELKKCQGTIKKWMDDHKQLIIEVGKLKQALDILKDKFEVVLCENDFPIPIIKYSIGFRHNNDGVWTHISHEEYELLKGVFNYE